VYLVDTSSCVTLLRGRSEKLRDRALRQRLDEVATSTLVVGELRYGAAKSSRPEIENREVDELLAFFVILPFDHAAANSYGILRATLQRAGKSIGAIDTLLAAQALSLSATLVTENVKEFRRVPELMVEDWTK
jgi:tRNA(fMet)-specific endonuclease VapC